MTIVRSKVHIDAPVEKVWATLADIGTIERWNPGVAKSYSTSEAKGGEGATRHCDLYQNNAQLEERAFDWQEGESFKIDVQTSGLPIESNAVTFTVSADGDGTAATVSADYKLKYGVLGALMDILIGKRQAQKGFDEMMAGLKYHVETGELVQDQVPVAAPA